MNGRICLAYALALEDSGLRVWVHDWGRRVVPGTPTACKPRKPCARRIEATINIRMFRRCREPPVSSGTVCTAMLGSARIAEFASRSPCIFCCRFNCVLQKSLTPTYGIILYMWSDKFRSRIRISTVCAFDTLDVTRAWSYGSAIPSLWRSRNSNLWDHYATLTLKLLESLYDLEINIFSYVSLW